MRTSVCVAVGPALHLYVNDMKITRLAPLMMGALSLIACGGSSSSSDGMVLEGTLVQGTEVAHERLLHEAGEAIENVEVCALNTCATTDGNGRWGFLTESPFTGGTLTMTIRGHGIDTTTDVALPVDAADVIVELVREGSNTVRADSVSVNGVEVLAHEDDDQHEHNTM